MEVEVEIEERVLIRGRKGGKNCLTVAILHAVWLERELWRDWKISGRKKSKMGTKLCNCGSKGATVGKLRNCGSFERNLGVLGTLGDCQWSGERQQIIAGGKRLPTGLGMGKGIDSGHATQKAVLDSAVGSV